VTRAPAPAKINLALVVGPRRDDGRHEVTTVLQRIDLCDRIGVTKAPATRVRGFADDTLVGGALDALAREAGAEHGWHVRIWKRIPVASGLGGGSSDAATALRVANATLDAPLEHERLVAIARALGADAPFFLEPGPQLGEGDGSSLVPLDLPQDYWVVLVLPHGERKPSTASVYEAFDRRAGENGHASRRDALLSGLAAVRRPRDLARLPPNDLASSPLADELRALDAFRADVTGAGPVVYGLFHRRTQAEAARRALAARGRTWLTVPAWYG
jgi:4-diphosphocytidyl-2-C-methyl-D-erythritol kinase